MDTEDLIALRRRFHAHAEPGFLEFHTASYVMDILEELGVDYTHGPEAIDVSAIAEKPTEAEYQEWGQRAIDAGVPAERVKLLQEQGTAVIAELKGNRPGPVWGLRVDIDALPIIEDGTDEHLPAREGFRSETGYMHACGHDGHTAIGLGLAERLRDGDFPGTVRIMFQPAEEGVRGAAPMLAAGVTRGIDRMLAVHLVASLPLGEVTGGASGFKATTKWKAQFTGEPSHAAGAPEKGRHAIAAAAQATLGVLGISRFATSDTRVNVGTFHASGSASIIPAEAVITYEVRADDNDVLSELDRRAEKVVQGAASMYDVEVTTNQYGGTTNSLPDEQMLDLIEDAASGQTAITEFNRTSDLGLGSDDAHLLINDVQKQGGVGSYILIGAQNSQAPHHNYRFDIDERSLAIATDLLETVFRSEG